MFASVIKTEAVSTAKPGSPLFVATLDAQKAFDVVDHQLLLLKAFNTGLSGRLWNLKQDSYHGLQSAVKWDGTVSQPFVVKQGVKQGGIQSTTDYKTFIDPLLIQLEDSQLGLSINGTDCGAPTVADDVLLLADSALSLQAMLTLASRYADDHKYKLHPTKSCVSVFGPKQCREFWKDVSPWSMDGNTLSVNDCTTHLGITRDSSASNPTTGHVRGKIGDGRKTAYALMGAGLHDLNGLHPHVSLHIYSTYVVPRIISGMESVLISKKDMQDIEVSLRKFLKQIQNLPQNTASSAVYLLLGASPIEATIHQNTITLFGAITRAKSSRVNDLAWKQLAANSLPKNSWFRHLQNLHAQYDLPDPISILEDPPSKQTWRSTVSKAITSYWREIFEADIQTKSTLRLFSKDEWIPGKPHNMWRDTNQDARDIRRGCVKARMLTGTYILQSNRAKFNQYDVDPTCTMCSAAQESMTHFLLHCPALDAARKEHLPKIQRHIPPDILPDCDDSVMEQIILNCPKKIQIGASEYDLERRRSNIETEAYAIYALHCIRASLLCYRP